MEPEDIDKLFKDRLSGLPAMPSADAWSRLQQKMEPPKKEKPGWMYYAAASISILLVIGLLFFRNQAPTLKPEIALEKPVMLKKITEDLPGQATESIVAASDVKKETEISQSEIQTKVKVVKENIMPAAKPVMIAKDAKTIEKETVPATIESELKQDEAPEVATAISKPAEADPVKVATQNPAQDIAFSTVQVLVKRDNKEETAVEIDNESFQANLARKGNLLKNIYKQARNFKNGDPVELAALGLNTEKLESERKAIKEKINKVISL